MAQLSERSEYCNFCSRFLPMTLIPASPTKRKADTADTNARRQGIKPARFSVEEISTRLVKQLKLSFTPALWQSHLIQRITQGYDSIFLAGTGYGKSLIFEGIAVMQPLKMVLVICPLKALEEDQVCSSVCPRVIRVLIYET
jgi:ATP-dependent helicase YprA (DUF1998 family)